MGRRTQKDYMQEETFAELMESAKQTLAYERGTREGYRVTQVETSKSPRRIPVGETVSPENQLESRRKNKTASRK
jgi:hypothetical protein